jgi:phage terminase large subunit GpA-like protein
MLMFDIGDGAPLAFVAAQDLVASCLSELRFPERVSVSGAARRHRMLNNPGAYSGPWGGGPHFVDHLDRVMDCLGKDSPHREVMVMGPSQVGKSEIGNNWQLHNVVYDPSDLLFVMPDRTSLDQYSKTQFDKMIENCSAMQEKLLSNTLNLKRFRGADHYLLWPTGTTFRAKPFALGRLDDFDEIPVDISDQGDAVALLYGRMGSFDAYGGTMIYVNSTPKLGANAGIEALVAAGTDERLWVDCLMCSEPFQLSIERLQYEGEGSPLDAAASAAVVCPNPECGGVHVQRDKRPLLETYRWVGKGEQACARADDPAGKTGALTANARASFRLDGLFGFRPWARIAELGRMAEIKFELEQDDGGLKAFDQTIAGRNYVQRHRGEAPVGLTDLEARAKASPYVLGEVPPGVEVLVASVDQQGNRFEVAVWGWGQGFRAWLIDRFDVRAIDVEGARPRALRPFTRGEDFAAIHRYVMQKTYPLAGAPGLRMKLFNTVLDTGGLDNATDNAFAWWHAMVKGDPGAGRPALDPTAITLFKGGNVLKGRLLPPPTADAKRQIKGAPQAELFIPNVNRVKDILDTRLNRRDEGPGYIAFARDTDPAHLAEMKAETKIGDQWVRSPHTANETMDLYVMAYTAVLRFGDRDASLSWVPDWARPPKGGPVKLDPAASDPGRVESDPKPAPAKTVRIGRGPAPGAASNRARRRVRSHPS